MASDEQVSEADISRFLPILQKYVDTPELQVNRVCVFRFWGTLRGKDLCELVYAYMYCRMGRREWNEMKIYFQKSGTT